MKKTILSITIILMIMFGIRVAYGDTQRGVISPAAYPQKPFFEEASPEPEHNISMLISQNITTTDTCYFLDHGDTTYGETWSYVLFNNIGDDTITIEWQGPDTAFVTSSIYGYIDTYVRSAFATQQMKPIFKNFQMWIVGGDEVGYTDTFNVGDSLIIRTVSLDDSSPFKPIKQDGEYIPSNQKGLLIGGKTLGSQSLKFIRVTENGSVVMALAGTDTGVLSTVQNNDSVAISYMPGDTVGNPLWVWASISGASNVMVIGADGSVICGGDTLDDIYDVILGDSNAANTRTDKLNASIQAVTTAIGNDSGAQGARLEDIRIAIAKFDDLLDTQQSLAFNYILQELLTANINLLADSLTQGNRLEAIRALTDGYDDYIDTNFSIALGYIIKAVEAIEDNSDTQQSLAFGYIITQLLSLTVQNNDSVAISYMPGDSYTNPSWTWASISGAGNEMNVTPAGEAEVSIETGTIKYIANINASETISWVTLSDSAGEYGCTLAVNCMDYEFQLNSNEEIYFSHAVNGCTNAYYTLKKGYTYHSFGRPNVGYGGRVLRFRATTENAPTVQIIQQLAN
jgi:hypothetical protein